MSVYSIMNSFPSGMTECRCLHRKQLHADRLTDNNSSVDFKTEMISTRVMRDERRRLVSYSNWPTSSSQDPTFLAEAGFFYTGSGDRVQCAFCLGVLKKWTPEDIPFVEHQKHFPSCRFIRGFDVGNSPLRASGIEQIFRVTSGESGFVANKNTTSGAVDPIQETGKPQNNYYTGSPADQWTVPTPSIVSSLLEPNFSVTIVKPSTDFYPGAKENDFTNLLSPCRKELEGQHYEAWQHKDIKHNISDYTIETNRLATFRGWPAESKLLPEEIARAGFYFVPTDTKPDRVKCGYCGGKLYGWTEGDEPMAEHSRCFPECPYIKLCVGKEDTSENASPNSKLRSSMATKQTRVSRESKAKIHNGKGATPEKKVKGVPDITNISANGMDDDLTLVMRSDAVQTVVAMGFPKEKVIQTVREKITIEDSVITGYVVVKQLFDMLL